MTQSIEGERRRAILGRDRLRKLHLVAMPMVGIYLYAPVDSDALSLLVRFMAFPMLVLTGLAMLQLPRLGRMLPRVFAIRTTRVSGTLLLMLTTIAMVLAVGNQDGRASEGLVTRDENAVTNLVLQDSNDASLRYRGRTSSRTFGRGTVSIRGELNGFTLVASFVSRYPLGRVRGVARITGRANSSGGITFSGTARITGGTGRYTKVRGRGRLKGKGPFDLSRAKLRQRGVVSY